MTGQGKLLWRFGSKRHMIAGRTECFDSVGDRYKADVDAQGELNSPQSEGGATKRQALFEQSLLECQG